MTTAPSELPSKKQRELLSFIDAFIKGYGYGPSYREVMRALNYKSVSTVATHINGLIARGYLAKKDHSARSLYVVTHTAAPAHDDPGKKWLLGEITRKFKDYEADPTSDNKDRAVILIGALKILGLDQDAEKFQKRLS